MMPVSNGLVESLKKLGLTEYEAKVYSALVYFDRAEVKQIYELLDAPKPSVYQSLRSLTDKGLVQVINAKPAVYRATPPKIAIRHMADVHRKAEDMALLELEELEKHRVDAEYPDVLWSLYGDRNIEYKAEEMLEGVKASVRMVLPLGRMYYLDRLRDRDISGKILVFGPDAKKAVEALGNSRIEVHDATTADLRDFAPFVKYFKDFPVRGEQFTRLLLIVVDDREFMYIPPLPGPVMTGMTSENPVVMSLVKSVFAIVWDHTR